MVRNAVLGAILTAPLVAPAAGAVQHGHLRAHAVPSHRLPATQYIGKVTVGSPGQEFRMVFDTASGTTILPSTRCEDAACMSHRRFASENSTSSIQIGWADDPLMAIQKNDDRDTKSFSLLGADVSGEFIRDSICVGGQGACSTIDFVGLTEESSEPFAQLQFDGVVGLGPSSPDASEFNFIQAFFQGRKPAEKVFSFYLAPSGQGAQDSGELTIGGYHAERAASALHWAPVATNGTWRVMVEDVAIGGEKMGICGKGCETSVDSGSSLIMAPGNALWAILKKLNVDDDCKNKVPTLSFVVGGQHLELDLEDYVERDESGCRMLLGSTSSAEKGTSFVLGYPFLRKFFTVYDLNQNRVGFAPANHAKVSSKAAAGMATVTLTGVRP